MRFRVNILMGIIIVSFMGMFYYQLINTYKETDFFQFHKLASLASYVFTAVIELPVQDEYLLKLKHLIRPKERKTIFLNGNLLELAERKVGSEILTEYYRVPKEFVHHHKNVLKIRFQYQKPPEIELWIRNYISSELSGNMYLLLANSNLIRNRPEPILNSLVFVLILFLLWEGIYCFWRNLFGIESILFQFISFLPSLLILGSAFSLPIIITPYGVSFSLLMSQSFLYSIVIFGVIFIQIILGGTVGFKKKAFYFRKEKRIKKERLLYGQLPSWTIKIINKIIEWLNARELSDKCILLFMVLLVFCAFFLMVRLTPLAEQLANFAYLFLAISIIIKFFKFAKGGR